MVLHVQEGIAFFKHTRLSFVPCPCKQADGAFAVIHRSTEARPYLYIPMVVFLKGGMANVKLYIALHTIGNSHH